MAWTTPKSWASGYVVLAADLNTHLRDNLNVTAPAVMTTAGDIIYASGANTPARLAKDANDTRSLTNTGGSNIPAWAQVNLANGVSGTLPLGNGGTGATSLTANGALIGNGSSAVTSVDMSTKGSLLAGDGTGNPSVLAVGSNDQVLTADSGETTGVKWAAAGGTTEVIALPGNGFLESAELLEISSGLSTVVRFNDGSTQGWGSGYFVPVGMTSISAIKIHFLSASTGNLYLELRTAHVSLGLSTTREIDTTEAVAAFSGGTVGDYEFVTVPAGAFNGLSSIVGGELIHLGIQRQAGHANDTYNADWKVVGCTIEFA